MSKFIIKVYQWKNSDPIATFKFNVATEQKSQVTEWLKENLAPNKNIDSNESYIFITSHEMHVLRFLRHIRTSFDGLPKLNPEMFEFWFDFPDKNGLTLIRADEDGDFIDRIPGGFFTERVSELF
jgi:hypothetical protein